jgi:hypothetical protein
MPLKVLNCSLVFPGCSLGLERSQIPALSSSRIFLSRVQPIFAGPEFPDHAVLMLTRRLALAAKISCGLVRHLHALALRCCSKAQLERQESPNPAPGALGNSSSGSRDRNSRK